MKDSSSEPRPGRNRSTSVAQPPAAQAPRRRSVVMDVDEQRMTGRAGRLDPGHDPEAVSARGSGGHDRFDTSTGRIPRPPSGPNEPPERPVCSAAHLAFVHWRCSPGREVEVVWRLLSTARAEQDHVFPKRLVDLSVVIHGCTPAMTRLALATSAASERTTGPPFGRSTRRSYALARHSICQVLHAGSSGWAAQERPGMATVSRD